MPKALSGRCIGGGILTLALHTSTIFGCVMHQHQTETSSSALVERPRELGDFKGMGHFEATF